MRAATLNRRGFLAATVPLASGHNPAPIGPFLVLLRGPSRRQPNGAPRVASVVYDVELASRLSRKLNRRGLSAEVIRLAGKGGAL